MTRPDDRPQLQPDYSLAEVAIALGMSDRWIRIQIKNGAEHTRYGHKFRFTSDQVDKLRSQFVRNEQPTTAQSITTGRRRRAG